MKLSLLRLFLLVGGIFSFTNAAWAQSDSLVINLKNGEKVTIVLSQIRKITFDSVTSSVSPVPAKSKLLNVSANYPNPSKDGVTFSFTIAERGTVSVTIHDNTGRYIRTIQSPPLAQGKNQLFWDGRDEAAREVSPGSYLAEIRFKSETEVLKVALVK